MAIRSGNAAQVAVPAGEYWSAWLRVAPANQDLAARNAETFRGADRRLATAPDGLKFDLAVIDCGPQLGGLFLSALHAADAVLVVTEPADNALAMDRSCPRSIRAFRTFLYAPRPRTGGR